MEVTKSKFFEHIGNKNVDIEVKKLNDSSYKSTFIQKGNRSVLGYITSDGYPFHKYEIKDGNYDS